MQAGFRRRNDREGLSLLSTRLAPASRSALRILDIQETLPTAAVPRFLCARTGRCIAVSCAMLAWAARHPHLTVWVRSALAAGRPRRPDQTYSWKAVT